MCNSSVTSLQVGASFTQFIPAIEDIIDPNWTILDSAFIATIIKDKALLSSIRDCTEDEIRLVHPNGGDETFHQQGDLNIVSIATHYNPTSLAIILSMKYVRTIPGIGSTMDNFEDSIILIHLSDLNVLKF